MKYAIIIPDGCADEPLQDLAGRTPMQVADIPAMDQLATSGIVGQACHCPMSMAPGSDVANLSLLGYDPTVSYSGRAPLEAAAQNIELADGDWAVRCNLVTVQNGRMVSFTADHITTEESTALLASLQERYDAARLKFVPSVSYRNLLICRKNQGEPFPFNEETYITPPHDLIGQPIADRWPSGPGSEWILRLMDASAEVFADHPVNLKRIAEGKLPATNIWLWGQGRRPSLTSFAKLRGVPSGAMITGVDLLRGIAHLIGWKTIDVPGATGYTDTDYEAKGRYACDALDEHDVVCVHVEAPDEAGHDGDAATKIKALESIDRHIVAPVVEKLQSLGEYRILVSPDHPTPVRLMTHTHEPVPWLIAGTGIEPDESQRFDEATAEASGVYYHPGFQVMQRLVDNR